MLSGQYIDGKRKYGGERALDDETKVVSAEGEAYIQHVNAGLAEAENRRRQEREIARQKKNADTSAIINGFSADKQHLADYVAAYRALEEYDELNNTAINFNLRMHLRDCLRDAKRPRVLAGDFSALTPAEEKEIREIITPALQTAIDCFKKAHSVIENPSSTASLDELHKATKRLISISNKMQGAPSLGTKLLGFSLYALGAGLFITGCFGMGVSIGLLSTPMAPLMPLVFVASLAGATLGLILVGFGTDRFASGFDRTKSSLPYYNLAKDIDLLPTIKPTTVIPKGFSFFAPAPKPTSAASAEPAHTPTGPLLG